MLFISPFFFRILISFFLATIFTSSTFISIGRAHLFPLLLVLYFHLFFDAVMQYCRSRYFALTFTFTLTFWFFCADKYTLLNEVPWSSKINFNVIKRQYGAQTSKHHERLDDDYSVPLTVLIIWPAAPYLRNKRLVWYNWSVWMGPDSPLYIVTVLDNKSRKI